MQKFKCRACGYIYDPAFGNPDKGVPPGTEFSELPDSWTCPTCFLPKEGFVVNKSPASAAR